MSHSTVLALDVAHVDLTALGLTGKYTRDVEAIWHDRMKTWYGLEPHSPGIRTTQDSLADVVFIDGPWRYGIYRGARSMLSIDAFQKWGVFLAQENERLPILREAAGAAQAFGATAVAIFSTDGAAYDMACENCTYAEIRQSLASTRKGLVLRPSSPNFVDEVSRAIGEHEDLLDDGYLEIVLAPSDSPTARSV